MSRPGVPRGLLGWGAKVTWAPRSGLPSSVTVPPTETSPPPEPPQPASRSGARAKGAMARIIVAALRRSIGVGLDDLAAADGLEAPPGGRVDRALEEVDAAVGEQHVQPAGVEAAHVVGVGE